MPIRITRDCTNCGACADVCPHGGIRRGNSAYVIDQDLCTECVGFFAEEQCVAICPIDCCVRNPRIAMTEEALFERAKAIHANSGKHPTLTAETSHFRVGFDSNLPEAAASNLQLAPRNWWGRLFRRKPAIDEEESVGAIE